MKSSNRIALLALAAFGFVLGGCDKTKPYDIDVAPPEAHFVNERNVNYSAADNPTPVFNVIVGTTDVAKVDRTVTYKVTPISNAIPGTDYSIATGNTTGTVTILAGQATANIPLQATYASFANGERDTLMFTIEQPSLKPSTFLDTVIVAIRGACFEGDVNLTEFLGTYANTNETFGNSPYGPYITTISSVSQLPGATTGSVVVTNIWDNGWGPITIDLDWTNPAARVTSLLQQDNIADGGSVNPQYAGISTVTVTNPSATSFPGVRGTFSICNQTLVLKMRICLLPLGCFGTTMYTVNMAR
jgi:hypothetical protein